MVLVWDFIKEYWYYVPVAMTVCGYIAKATPNKTDDKILLLVMKIVDAISLHPEVTKTNTLQIKEEVLNKGFKS